MDLVLVSAVVFDRIAHRLAEEQTLAAPHLLDVEVAQVLRRLVRAGGVDAARAAEALDDLAVMPIQRYSHLPLLERIFALRDNVTAYDAAYLALAEELAVPLITRERALMGVPGCRAVVEIV